MYHLSPLSLKPDVRASRSQHGPFQNKIARLIEKLSSEREIVDLEHSVGRILFNTMDTFFCYGLLSGDRAYWRFVKEFLPKTQQELLRANWGDMDSRRLSIAWLKDAFNKSTLHFQMLSFRNNRKVIMRFYHRNACMCNGGMLEAITDMITSLVNVQFAFYSTLCPRVEPVQAIVVEPPITPVAGAKSRRKKKADSCDECQTTVLDETLPTANDISVLPSQLDQEVILDELVRKRQHRMHHCADYTTTIEKGMDSGVDTSGDSSDPLMKSEGFDEVLRKTMSQVQMDLKLEPKSIENLFQHDDMQQDRNSEDDLLVEGEVLLDPGDILNLAMEVYVDEGERLLRMFHVYQRFATGMPLSRFLAITDHNVYVITQKIVQGESVQHSMFGKSVHRNMSYETNFIIPLMALDYVGVSMDSHVIVLYAKNGFYFWSVEEANKNKEKACAIATGDSQLGNAIVKTITSISISQNVEPPAVFTESTPYCLLIKRYLTKEMNESPHIELCHFSLVFWKESLASIGKQNSENVGYLYRRTIHPNWWRKPQAEWIQSYFVLMGSKMYVFADSTCKEGELVINLSDCSEILELDPKKDCQWGFELELPDGKLQLQCPSKDDMNRWINAVNLAMNSQDDNDAAACIVMITDTNLIVAQEGEKCFTDGFIRTLMSFPLTHIRSGWIVRIQSHMTLILRVDAMHQWFIFRSEDELCRMVKTLSVYPIPLLEVSHNSQDKLSAYILNQCYRMPIFWQKTGTVSKGFDSET